VFSGLSVGAPRCPEESFNIVKKNPKFKYPKKVVAGILCKPKMGFV
jgi:hypothetical protein